MAKAPFWLRGGKGKLAGSVLFKGEKGTIVRENVTPHNPQSGGQMRQRVVWATVTQAAKRMLPIIGISFEGIGSEKLNRRKFVQLNATLLSNMARNIMASGDNPNGMAFAGKNNTQLIPNPYIISRGTLQLPHVELAPVSDGAGSLESIAFEVTIPFGTYSVVDLWYLVFGFKPGSQFTMPYIITNDADGKWASEIQDTNGISIDGIRYANFFAPRIVVKESSEETFTINAQTTAALLIEALKKGVDATKTNTEFLDYFASLEISDVTQTNISIEAQPDLDSMLHTNNYNPKAVGTIYSEQNDDGSWKYTNSRMVTLMSASFPNVGYYGLGLKNAMDTFRKTNTTDKNYLQTGGEGGNI